MADTIRIRFDRHPPVPSLSRDRYQGLRGQRCAKLWEIFLKIIEIILTNNYNPFEAEILKLLILYFLTRKLNLISSNND